MFIVQYCVKQKPPRDAYWHDMTVFQISGVNYYQISNNKRQIPAITVTHRGGNSLSNPNGLENSSPQLAFRDMMGHRANTVAHT